MSRYEQAFDTDWDSLEEEEAVDRAYALGVAASLGEYHPEELEAIRGEADTAYSRSLIDLAFDQGKNESKKAEAAADDDDAAIWEQLVAEEPVTFEPDDLPTGDRTGLPEAIGVAEALDLQHLDRTEAIELPDFLGRE